MLTDSAKQAFTVPFANPSWFKDGATMRIPANEEGVTHDFALDPSSFLQGFKATVHSAALHMHQLGTRGKLTIERNGGNSECMLDIPRWDFNWQRAYTFDKPKKLAPGDKLRIECSWDNTTANQPIYDGKRRPPRDVGWGDGTNDEMCLGVFYVTLSL